MKNGKKYVAYYRVSTKKQEISGLGIDSQKEQVLEATKNGQIIGEFIEIESGRKNERPELKKAMAFAKENNAILIIAKLDRLSRNASFIMALRDSGVKFQALDIPGMDFMTIGVLALVAQKEAELVSQRTKAALKVRKDKGLPCGNPQNLTNKSREISIKVRKEKAMAQDYNLIVKRFIEKNPALSYRAIAKMLNDYGIRTKEGKEYQAMTVRQIAKLYDLKRNIFQNIADTREKERKLE